MYLPVGILQDGVPLDLDLDLVGHVARLLQLLLQILVLALVVSRVRHCLHVG